MGLGVLLTSGIMTGCVTEQFSESADHFDEDYEKEFSDEIFHFQTLLVS
jgi:hypothetical protein